jgi:hypothetical protein
MGRAEIRYDYSVTSSVILWVDMELFYGPIGYAAAAEEIDLAWKQLGTRILLN